MEKPRSGSAEFRLPPLRPPSSSAAREGADRISPPLGDDLGEMIVRLQEEIDVLRNPMTGVHDEIRRYRGVVRGVLLSLMSAIEAKHRPTYEHCRRVSALALLLGRAMGHSERDLETLEYGGLLHDVGNIGMPEQLLARKGELTAEEERLLRDHTTRGDRIVRKVPDLDAIADIVRLHHEQVDGHGYPDGLSGDAIPLPVRVVACADYFDTIARPHGTQAQALSANEALAKVREVAGVILDREVVAAMASFENNALVEEVLRDNLDGVLEMMSPAR